MTSAAAAQIELEAEAYAAELRRERARRLGEEAVTWLALMPQWTGLLALECKFPAPKPLASWLKEATAVGLCRQRWSFDMPDAATEGDDVLDDLQFWMPATERTEYLSAYASRTKLRSLAAEIGARILHAAGNHTEPSVRRWAELAHHAPNDPQTGEWLMNQVQDCLGAGRAPDALAWVYAAEALTPILGEEISSASSRARRLISLEYQHRLDERFLQHFLLRPEQSDAVRRLLRAGGNEPWALHFVGMGGVGKTMLIRYISSGLRTARGQEVVASRIDFDHISPHFPAEQPGQLLRELAAGLSRRLIDADQVSAYRRFLECESQLDDKAGGTLGGGAIDSREFEVTLESFAELIRAIGNQVVLVLDTCEELAKLHPAGEPVPNVERTFEILERLHAKVPEVRVVLAGRRLLASRYANWPPAGGPSPRSAVSLSERGYVELQEVRGFSEREARALLAASGVDAREDSALLIPAILNASPETGRAADLVAAEGGRMTGERRFNPYELAVYAEWCADADQEVTAADIEGEHQDAYVEGRIIARLPTDLPVSKVLPLLAVLGRVDLCIMRACLDQPDTVIDRVFRILAQQEWVVSRGAEGVTVLEVQPGVLNRLDDYYGRSTRAHERVAAVERLRTSLTRLVTTRRPFDSASVEHIAALLRILPGRPAAARWHELAVEIERDGEWSWAAEVCSRLLASEGDQPVAGPISAAVRAVYIGSLLRRTASYQSERDWELVSRDAALHPEETQRAVLRDRAALGSMTDHVRHGQPGEPPKQQADWHRAWLRAQHEPPSRPHVVAALALVQSMLDSPDDAAARFLPPASEIEAIVNRAAELSDAVLRGLALILQARCEQRRAPGSSNQRGDIAAKYARAEAFLNGTTTYASPCDWPLPREVAARGCLEWLRATLGAPDLAPPREKLERWIQECDECNSVDEERLASAALLRLISYHEVSAEIVGTLDSVVRRLPVLRPAAPAHLDTPSLAATVIRAWIVLGHPIRARSLGTDVDEAGAIAERDPASAAHLNLANIHSIRWMRWQGQRDALLHSLAAGDDREQAFAAAATLTLLGRADRGSPADPDGASTDLRWRTSEAWRPLAAAELLSTTESLSRPVTDPVLAGSLALDRLEAHRLTHRRRKTDETDETTVVEEAEAALGARLLRGEGSLAHGAALRSLRLRRWALTSDDNWPTCYGQRIWADSALEEGELLALRLPVEAQRLLGLAKDLFTALNDPTAACLAQVRMVIAMDHAGDRTASRDLLHELKLGYDQWRLRYELPSWYQLEERSRKQVAETGLTQEPWDGWLLRVGACLASHSGKPLRSPAAVGELDLGGPSRRRARLAKPFKWFQSAAYGVFGTLFYAGVFLGMGKGISAVVGWDPPWWLAILIGSGVAIALIAVFIAAGSVLPMLTARRLRLVVTIEPVGSAFGSSPEAHVRARILPTSRLMALMAGLLNRWTFRGASGNWVLTDLTEGRLSSLPKELAVAIRRSRRWGVREMELRIDPGVDDLPWELELGTADVSTSIFERGLTAFRTYQAATSPRMPPVFPAKVGVLCSRSLGLLAEDAWQHAGATPRLYYASDLRELEKSNELEVLHVIGTPALTEAGRALSIEAGAGAARVDRFPLTRTSLVILQAEPNRSSVSTDPRAAQLRSIAHDIARASGGATVIVLPPLPPHIARTLTEQLARGLASADKAYRVDSEEQIHHEMRRADVIELVRRMRLWLFADSDREADARERAAVAYDLCIYLGA